MFHPNQEIDKGKDPLTGGIIQSQLSVFPKNKRQQAIEENDLQYFAEPYKGLDSSNATIIVKIRLEYFPVWDGMIM